MFNPTVEGTGGHDPADRDQEPSGKVIKVLTDRPLGTACAQTAGGLLNALFDF